MPTTPPGLVTRNISRATVSGLGVNWAPNEESTRSKRSGSRISPSSPTASTACSPRGELGAKRGEHAVEAVGLEGEILGVGLHPLDLQPRRGRLRTTPLD